MVRSEVISSNNNTDVMVKLNKMINISQPFCTDQQDIDRFDQIKTSINKYNEVTFSSKSDFFNIIIQLIWRLVIKIHHLTIGGN
jgi:hypothetical protein